MGVNRLVLASLNQGARLLGRLFPPSDPVVAAAMRGGFDFPDGPYGPHDYGLTDFEEANEVHEPHVYRCGNCGSLLGPVCVTGPNGGMFCSEACRITNSPLYPNGMCGKLTTRSWACLLPADHNGICDDNPFTKAAGPQEMPDELWRPKRYCGDVNHTLAGTYVCDLPADHDGAPYWGHESGSSVGWGVAPPESSAPVPRAVVAGASPGGATHPAPPGEREPTVSEFVDVMREHRLWAVDGKPGGHMCQCGWTSDYPVSDHKEHLARRLVAALYPMQPRPETEAQPKWCGCASCDCGAFPPAHK